MSSCINQAFNLVYHFCFTDAIKIVYFMTICQFQLNIFNKVVIIEVPTHLQVIMTNIKMKLGSNGFFFNIFNGKSDKHALLDTYAINIIINCIWLLNWYKPCFVYCSNVRLLSITHTQDLRNITALIFSRYYNIFIIKGDRTNFNQLCAVTF